MTKTQRRMVWILTLILALGVAGCNIPSEGQPTDVRCDELGEASTLSSKSASKWADEYMGICADFDGRLLSSRAGLHIVGSWDAPYGLDIVVKGSKACLDAEEHVAGLGTPVSFVGKVVGTHAVDNLRTGGKASLPLVQCWDGNRSDLVKP